MWSRAKSRDTGIATTLHPTEVTKLDPSDDSVPSIHEPARNQAPQDLIPVFMRMASEEIPWHADETIESRDIERALRAVREHFERTYPHGDRIDWMGLSENCKLRLHFTVLDQFDFNCPTLSHLVSMRKTSRQELIDLLLKAADMAEERRKQIQKSPETPISKLHIQT